ncbi:hypothetical protein DPMN_014010 [Dreissena polymorpha]|uniref:Uncharacterized protein n=1 Tax=Dreissena polymorpha TaxID=45954 RepID=A0A9D4N8M1_DREPO|nr:hypothetical protein DPMN_014010 [Dreissena polymorpha]
MQANDQHSPVYIYVVREISVTVNNNGGRSGSCAVVPDYVIGENNLNASDSGLHHTV